MSKAVEFGFLSIKVKTSSLQFGHCVRMGYGPKIKFTLIFIFCLFWRMAWLHYTKYKPILIKKQQSNFRLYMYIWLSIAIKQFSFYYIHTYLQYHTGPFHSKLNSGKITIYRSKRNKIRIWFYTLLLTS